MSRPVGAVMEQGAVDAAVLRLVKHHGIKHPEKQRPFDCLVCTLLSQHTTEAVSMPVARVLLERYPTPAALAASPAGELEALLEPIGLHRQKAGRLCGLSRLILERFGGDAGRLLELPAGEMRRELLSIKGVGDKTADCFMLFAAGLDVLPVDTHVARIARRWGLVDGGAGYHEVRSAFESALQPGLYGRAHVVLIHHGRETCRARRPLCDECRVYGACPFPTETARDA